jgi:hypothetical protein
VNRKFNGFTKFFPSSVRKVVTVRAQFFFAIANGSFRDGISVQLGVRLVSPTWKNTYIVNGSFGFFTRLRNRYRNWTRISAHLGVLTSVTGGAAISHRDDQIHLITAFLFTTLLYVSFHLLRFTYSLSSCIEDYYRCNRFLCPVFRSQFQADCWTCKLVST